MKASICSSSAAPTSLKKTPMAIFIFWSKARFSRMRSNSCRTSVSSSTSNGTKAISPSKVTVQLAKT